MGFDFVINMELHERLEPVQMIGRDEGIFVKTMYGFKKSCAKEPHKLKMHMRGATSVKLTLRLSIW